MQLIVNADGASRGNPGPSSYGFIIRDRKSGAILHQEGKTIGKATNNIAEYTAVLKAFEYMKAHMSHKLPHQIEVYLDSMLVAKQLSGFFKIKNINLKPLFGRIKILEYELGQISFFYIPRSQNFLADRLANQALDLERQDL